MKIRTSWRSLSALIFLCSMARAQATLNLSEDLVRLRIASINMLPNQPSTDARPLFEQGVAYASRNGYSNVIADPGSYYFLTLGATDIYADLGSLSNLTIDLQGSDLYFAAPFNVGIHVLSGTNLTMQNFTLDYLQLPFTQLLVTSVDSVHNQVQFTVQSGFQKPSALDAFLNSAASTDDPSVSNIQPWLFVFRNGEPLTSRIPVQMPVSDTALSIPNGNPTPAQYLAGIRAGDTLVLSLRQYSGLPFAFWVGGGTSGFCNSCTFRNITIYSGSAEGFGPQGTKNSLYERIYVMPRPGTGRLVSTMADGISPFQSGPGNTLRLCRVVRNQDDGISVPQWVYAMVQSTVGSRSVQVAGPFGTALQQGSSYALPNGTNVAFEGTGGTSLGNANIVSQSTPQYVNGVPQMTFTFDADLPSGMAGSYMYAAAAELRASGLTLDRNTIQTQTSGAGVSVWGAWNFTLSGNYIHKTHWSGVNILHTLVLNNWIVPPTVNATLNGNVVDGTNLVHDSSGNQLGGVQIEAWAPPNYVLMATSPHKNATITNNFIADPARSAVFVSNTSGGTVTGNYFLNPNANVDPATAWTFLPGVLPQEEQPVGVFASANVIASGNTIDTTSARMYLTDTQFTELAAYAPGTTYRLNAYGLGMLSKPAITVTDSSGAATSVSIKAQSANSIDIQIPASATLGGAFFTLNSGSSQYFATAFLDSQDNLPASNGCSYEVSPSSASVPSGANNLSFLVVTQTGCAYQALGADSFVTAGASGSGTSVVAVGFLANNGPARMTMIEIAGQQFTVTQATFAPTVQAIVDSWDYTPGLAPGEWVTITGTNLASGSPQTWNLTGAQQLPTTLGGVTVTFNGASAALLYVSATQINALVPSTIASGSVQVIVQSGTAKSAAFNIAATGTLPAIYALPTADGSSFYVTAALAGTATLVGNSAVDPRVTRAVQPGDDLDLYMIGLGATSDPAEFITDQVFSGAYQVSASVTASIGGEAAQVQFAGLTSPGLYLVRVAVPSDMKAGPQAIQITAGKTQTGPLLKLSVAPSPGF